MQLYRDVVLNQLGRGIPEVSAEVRVVGTTTKALIFAADGTEQANPTTTDSDGTFSFRAPNGRYEVVLTKEGVNDGVAVTVEVLLHDPADDAQLLDGAGKIIGTLLGAHSHSKTDIRDFDHAHQGYADRMHVHADLALRIHAHAKADIGDFAHTHPLAQVDDLDLIMLQKANAYHVHNREHIADFAHGHLIGEIPGLDAILVSKADVTHTHTMSAVNLDVYSRAEINDMLVQKSPLGHGHAAADVSGFDAAVRNVVFTDVETGTMYRIVVGGGQIQLEVVP